MTAHEDLRSPRDVDADAERYLDEIPVERIAFAAVEFPMDGSIPDIVDQHLEVPDDDDV